MDISVKIIPHSMQRYPTVGDWIFIGDEKKRLLIFVSDMGDWRYNALVSYHEQVEALLCYLHGVSEESVTFFDIQYEKNRRPGNYSEPGDDPRAPYYSEHQIATKAEKELALQMGVDWEEYEKAVNSL